MLGPGGVHDLPAHDGDPGSAGLGHRPAEPVESLRKRTEPSSIETFHASGWKLDISRRAAICWRDEEGGNFLQPFTPCREEACHR